MAKAPAVEEDADPDDFRVSGPRNLSKLNWRDILRSSWEDENYKRTAIACFIQAVYLLESDRQENRAGEKALAPNWWKPFKYKVAEVLVDDRDSSIFGATLEWDRSAAACDLLVVRPSKAPRAIISLRGTLLKAPTLRRDIEDDLRIFARENLRGSCRFRKALEAVKSAVKKHGNGAGDVCIAGHSLGAALALQVGRALAEEGICVEAHLFNPPSVSLPMGLRSIGKKVEFLWNLAKGAVVHVTDPKTGSEKQKDDELGCRVDSQDIRKWAPRLYLNDNDYICCHYLDKRDGSAESIRPPEGGRMGAKLFVMRKGPSGFLEAHGLQQWWSHDTELLMAASDSKLIQRQLGSFCFLYQPLSSKMP